MVARARVSCWTAAITSAAVAWAGCETDSKRPRVKSDQHGMQLTDLKADEPSERREEATPLPFVELTVPAWDGPPAVRGGHALYGSEPLRAFRRALSTATTTEAVARLVAETDVAVVIDWLRREDYPPKPIRAPVAAAVDAKAAAAHLSQTDLMAVEDLIGGFIEEGLTELSLRLLAHFPASRFESRRLQAAWADLGHAYAELLKRLPNPIPAALQTAVEATAQRFGASRRNPCILREPPVCPNSESLRRIEGGRTTHTFCVASAHPSDEFPKQGRVFAWSSKSPLPRSVTDRILDPASPTGYRDQVRIRCSAGFPWSVLEAEGQTQTRHSEYRAFGLLRARLVDHPDCQELGSRSKRIEWFIDGVALGHGCAIRDPFGLIPRGPTTLLYASGEKRCAGHYGDLGRREGMWKCWRKDGSLLSSGSFHPEVDDHDVWDRGTPQGEWVLYHSNGEASQRGAFEKGVRTGSWRSFDDSGALVSKGSYTPLPRGENGRLVGVRHGPWTEWSGGRAAETRYWCQARAPAGVHWLDVEADVAAARTIVESFAKPGFSALRRRGDDYVRPECGPLEWHQLTLNDSHTLAFRMVQDADAAKVEGVYKDGEKIRFFLRGTCEPWTFAYPSGMTTSSGDPIAVSAGGPFAGPFGQGEAYWVRTDHAGSVPCAGP